MLPGLNLIEVCLLAAALLILAIYLSRLFADRKTALLLTAILAPVMLLSVERVTTFLSIDEDFLMAQVVNLAFDPLSALDTTWFRGDGRTTIGGFAPIAYLLNKFAAGQPEHLRIAILKGLHWLVVVMVLLPIHWLLDRYFVSAKSRPYFALIYFATALLLPTNSLAIKTFAYDSLSLMLGVLALLLIYAALRDSSVRYGLAAVVIATLAAQEKPIASPILLMAVTIFAIVQISGASLRSRLPQVALRVALGIAIFALIGLLSVLVVVAIKRGDGTLALIQSIPYPMVSWLLPFLLQGSTSFDASLDTIIPSLMLPGLGIAFAACVISALVIISIQRGKLGAWLMRTADSLLPRVSIGVVLALLVIGIIGAFTVDAFVTNTNHSMPDGIYNETALVGGHTRYYLVESRPAHLLMHTAFTTAIMIVTLPTVIWLMWGLCLATLRLRFVTGDPSARAATQVMLLIGAAFPLIYGMLDAPYSMPPSARYFNIGVFLFVIGLLVWSSGLFEKLARYSPAITALYLVLLVAEVLPFRPLHIPFRAVWFNLPDSNEEVQSGTVDPVWSGWGEDIAFVGEWMAAQCDSSGEDRPPSDELSEQACSEIKLWAVYPGLWIAWDTPIQRPLLYHDPMTYTAYDYYVYNRSAITTGRELEPEGIEPIYTLRYRGYVQAWVYQGDDLLRAGYTIGE